jgi:superfamily I DNA and/or RNA helicase
MLDIQYRMNEEIAEFSNNEFYGGKLKSAGQLGSKISQI